MKHLIDYFFTDMKKDSRITTADPCDDSLGPAATSEQSESSTEKVTNRAVVISMSPIMGSEHGRKTVLCSSY